MAPPEEIKKLLNAIGGSKEQSTVKIDLITGRISR